jgi:hypothetical protein
MSDPWLPGKGQPGERYRGLSLWPRQIHQGPAWQLGITDADADADADAGTQPVSRPHPHRHPSPWQSLQPMVK